MHLLLIGGGGREHAMAWKLAQSRRVTRISVAPGNAGIGQEPKVACINVAADDIDSLVEFATTQSVDLTIVGPEAPLVAGIVDRFQQQGLRIFGPHQQAARLEGSKAFAKQFMAQNGIPTASSHSFSARDEALAWIRQSDIPVVIKADGLAAGKGVVVATSLAQAEAAVDEMFAGKFGEAGTTVVIEDFLSGEEASFMALVSGNDYHVLASSQDHKARDEGDQGPNTGGMGAYSPAPVVDHQVHERVISNILEPTVKALANESKPYVGFLYIGLMIDDTGQPRVIEYNVRLGDPETQPLMMRLSSDLLDALEHAVNGTLSQVQLDWNDGAAICVVLAASDYPQGSSKNRLIAGITDAETEGCKVFHAGTTLLDQQIVTNGGRVLGVTAIGDDLQQAKKRADTGSSRIRWDGMHYRQDIGYRALQRQHSVD